MFLSKKNLSHKGSNSTCYIILGHEINQESFELSFSGKSRCKVLANHLRKSGNFKSLVIFMGLGRLQGECELSISECMFNFFSEKYFKPLKYIIEKKSKDTIGDSIFSFELIKSLSYVNKVYVVTSDWHMKRTKYIFRRVFPNKYRLNFIQSQELDLIEKNVKVEYENKEDKSIKETAKFFRKFKEKEQNIFVFLKNNHKLYKS